MSSLLLISEVPEDLEFAKVVAQTAGCELLHAKTAAEGVDIFQKQTPHFLFADGSSQQRYQELETLLHDKVGLFSELVHPNTIHFISAEPIDAVPFLLQSPIFGHLIYRRFDKVAESGVHYGRILAATRKERAFGLESLLAAGTKVQTLSFRKTDQKQKAVDAIRDYLMKAHFQARMATLISNAIDETLMNAMFDAPVDDAGKHIYSATPRSTVLKLEGKSAVEMQLGFDGIYFAVTAVDHFGSLDKGKLLSHISKSYTDVQYKVKANQAGAGLGLATVYRSGGSFFFASEVRERTEVTLFFKRTESYRDFKDQFRFFSTQFYF